MFTEWFNQQYLRWRGERYGRDVTPKAFSRYLGLTQQTTNSYLNGNSRPRDLKIIKSLADKLGAEIYNELGLVIKPYKELEIELQRLPPELYPELITQIRKLRAKYIPPNHSHTENSDFPNE